MFELVLPRLAGGRGGSGVCACDSVCVHISAFFSIVCYSRLSCQFLVFVFFSIICCSRLSCQFLVCVCVCLCSHLALFSRLLLCLWVSRVRFLLSSAALVYHISFLCLCVCVCVCISSCSPGFCFVCVSCVWFFVAVIKSSLIPDRDLF
jgi:hypothetical protein